MRVNRALLYTGVFLVALGGVIVAGELLAIDTVRVTDALRLWPLAIVAIGAAIALRRTDLALPTGMLAAAIPGLILGGALAVAPRFAVDCGGHDQPPTVTTERGSFDGPARVSLTGGCGTITVRTAPGDDWQLAVANSAGRVPSVTSSQRSLSVASIGHEDLAFLDAGRDEWDLTIPTSAIDDLSLEVLAGEGQVGLDGARIGRLAVTANVADVVVDASNSSVATLTGAVGVGSMSILLPADSDLDGTLRIGAGQLQVCAPPGLGLRLTTRGTAKDVTVGGRDVRDAEWQSPGYASALRHADIHVNVDFGTVEIDPIGGCK
jgi:hypothetical protein